MSAAGTFFGSTVAGGAVPQALKAMARHAVPITLQIVRQLKRFMVLCVFIVTV
jgi:hypothetical protein